MRQALNENRTVQLIVVGVLLVATAFLVMSSGPSGRESGPPENEASSGEVGVTPTPSSDTTAPSAAGSGTAPTAPSAAGSFEAVTPAQGAVSPLVPGPGLPRAVVTAHNRGDTVALLVVRAGGIDDRLMRSAVGSLEGEPNVAVFTIRADGVARYSRITQGVGLNQVPALIVIGPSDNGAAPSASVSYGFRSAASVVQAVRDAAYTGKSRGYHPG